MNFELKPRTIEISGQIFPLRNIARIAVQEHTREWKHYRVDVAGYAIWVLICVLVAIFVPLVFEAPEANGVSLVALLAAAFLTYLAVESYRSMVHDREFRIYSLEIETAGGPHGAVFSSEREAVEELKERLVGHIEDPPDVPFSVVLESPTYVSGDQVNVHGRGNVAKVVQ